MRGKQSPSVIRTGFAVAVLLLAGLTFGPAASTMEDGGTAPCYDGFQTLQQTDNSFRWQEPTFPFRSVSWSGEVRLLERKDADCRIAEIRVEYNGPALGGIVTVNGDDFASFTVQYPQGFTDYANVGADAWGDLAMWNPPHGVGLGYVVHTNFDINWRGGDEYVIQGSGPSAVVPGVVVSFRVPLSLLGQTVYAQIHVGNNLCQCSVVPLTLPGSEFWDVYVHAHQDDWQLFESPNPYHDYQRGANLLFIYATAGDAGNPAPYWQVREDAAEASAQWLVPAGPSEQDTWVDFCYLTSDAVCHSIWVVTFGRTVSVFMRAPDGGIMGGGFPLTNYETLEKLRDGVIPSLTTVDGSTTYQGWADFYRTLGAIIDAYAPHDGTTWINAPDFDRERQTTHVLICDPCPDHADHMVVADAVYEITVADRGPWSRAWFIDYPIAWADDRYPVNLGEGDYDVKKALFMAYNDEVKRQSGLDTYSTMPWFYENAFGRDYFRFA